MFAHITHDEISMVSVLVVVGFALGAFIGLRLLQKIFK